MRRQLSSHFCPGIQQGSIPLEWPLADMSELPLHPFPMEQYCSVYHFTAVHLVQILQGFLSWPYRQEPPPQTLLFYMSMCRHLHVVNADPEAGAFNFHFLKSASLHPFLLWLTLDAWCALGSGLSERCHTNFQSFGYSPFFLEYELVLNDIFVMNDDHNVEDSESNDKDKDQNEGEEGEEGKSHWWSLWFSLLLIPSPSHLYIPCFTPFIPPFSSLTLVPFLLLFLFPQKTIPQHLHLILSHLSLFSFHFTCTYFVDK